MKISKIFKNFLKSNKNFYLILSGDKKIISVKLMI